MNRFFVPVLALCALAAAPPAASPEGTVNTFYSTYWALKISGGVPDSKARGMLEPYLSASLTAELAKAEKAELRYAQRTKNHVPPLIEGDLFTSLFEGATGLDEVRCATEAKTARCTAALRYDDPSSKEIVRWSDGLDLIATDGGWRVDDISYGGTWEFMHKGRLREVLAQAVRDGDAPLN